MVDWWTERSVARWQTSSPAAPAREDSVFFENFAKRRSY